MLTPSKIFRTLVDVCVIGFLVMFITGCSTVQHIVVPVLENPPTYQNIDEIIELRTQELFREFLLDAVKDEPECTGFACVE